MNFYIPSFFITFLLLRFFVRSRYRSLHKDLDELEKSFSISVSETQVGVENLQNEADKTAAGIQSLIDQLNNIMQTNAPEVKGSC